MDLPCSSVSPAFGNLKGKDFGKDFLFGFSSAAFQYEGAADKRGKTIWDTFLEKKHPEVIAEGGLGAINFYNRYKEDIRIMKEMGVTSFRFSISWSRLLPHVDCRRISKVEGVNREAVDFYKGLINELKANGIEPLVTLFHWDVPQVLEDEYNGFRDNNQPRRVVKDFCDYARVCFSLFGDVVKKWITFNEPWSFAIGGYATGTLAPGRGGSPSERTAMASSLPFSPITMAGNITTVQIEGDAKIEPYVVGHNILLAHAAVVKLYRTEFKEKQRGEIGISLVSNWAEPFSDSSQDTDAAHRVIDFMLGWFLNPITYGQYPKVMLDNLNYLGRPLPRFSDEDKNDLRGSYDFLGLNYYTANYARCAPGYDHKVRLRLPTPDSEAICTAHRNSVPIGEQAASPWLYVYPQGIRKLLVYIKQNYKDPVIYITENGRDELRDDKLSWPESLKDYKRIQYHYDHLVEIKKAIDEDEVKVKGYYVWSLMDNLEWTDGFKYRFGMCFVDYKDKLKRHPKDSAKWFKYFLQKDHK